MLETRWNWTHAPLSGQPVNCSALPPSSRSSRTTYQGAGRRLAHLGQDTSFSTGSGQDPEDWEEQREDGQHAIYLRKSEPYPGILRSCCHNVEKKGRDALLHSHPQGERNSHSAIGELKGREAKPEGGAGQNVTAGRRGPSLPGAGEGCTARK